MRKITLFPVPLLLLLLTACPPETQVQPVANNDSSPIIIADGSIHVKHKKSGRDHFQAKTSTSVNIQANNYFPKSIGFLCEPAITDPSATGFCPVQSDGTKVKCGAYASTSASINSSACLLDPIDVGGWELALCRGNAPCSRGTEFDITGNISSSTMAITSVFNSGSTTNGYFTYNPASNHTGELVYTSYAGSTALGSASLTGTSVVYQFSCLPNNACLAIEYHCDNGCQ